MSNRLHIYELTDDQQKDFILHHNKFEPILVVDLYNSLYNIYFTEATPLVTADTDDEYYPCIISKPQLKKMIEALYKEYQQYLVSLCINTPQYLPVSKFVEETSYSELWNRCLHLNFSAPYFEEDERVASIRAVGLLHQEFIIFNHENSFKDFMEFLDDDRKFPMNNLSLRDTLMSLVYLYKTYNSDKRLVLYIW